MKKSLILLVSLLILAISVPAFAATKLKTAWLDEHETFLIWYAKQKGWDKEENLDIDMLLFSSGMDQLAALPAGEWQIAGTGGVPAMIGAARYNTIVVGNGNDESFTNAVMVRPDSPILKTKGYNKDYPEVYGHPNDVKGKTFLVTTMSSAHFAFSKWLEVLGLTDKDVTINNIDQAQAVAAFDNKIGDGVALWAPHLFVGESKGWKVAGTPNACKAGLPIVLIADSKWAEANPETVAKFLRVYIRAVNMMQQEPIEVIIPQYKKFFLEFVGYDFDDEMCKKDIQTHPVFNLDEQLALFDTAKGMSEAQRWQQVLAEFFVTVGRITPDDLKKIDGAKYVTDKYLKLVQKPIPPYK